jgi:(p)ppGpp synthase/HD superfamily hydrolase
MNLIEKAKAFAKIKHKGQVRRFENKPYYIHPKRVAHILQQFKVSRRIEELVCAAYLHDTLEDTDTTFQEIAKEFNNFIAKLVFELTSDDIGVMTSGKGPYLLNKMINMSNYALAIKLADRIDNVNRINWMPEKFKNKYITETRFIMDGLKEKRGLTGTHKKMVKEIEKHLNEQEAVEDIDYLVFDSYHKRGNFDEAVI